MAVTLSPWATSPAALKTATAALRLELFKTSNASDPFAYDEQDELVQRLGGAAAALVEGYCSEAPQAVKDEAVVRCAGWMVQQPSAALRSEKIGDLAVDYATTHVSALRHSGAMALLTVFKIRRAPS